MIIWNLDSTLADCEHRQNLVDPTKNSGYSYMEADMTTRLSNGYFRKREETSGFIKFKPDWKSFYEACDKDEPIEPVMQMFKYQVNHYRTLKEVINWQIWSVRCESVREKTILWLSDHLSITFGNGKWDERLKMRPIGDSTPDDVLKEKWLDESLSEGKKIDYVFDCRPKAVRMWHRRGIFVFNCDQKEKEDY